MTESDNNAEKNGVFSRMPISMTEVLIRSATLILMLISISEIIQAVFFHKTFESDLDLTKFLILIGSVIFITILNVGLGILGIKSEKNTSETKLLSTDKPLSLKIENNEIGLQMNLNILTLRKKELKLRDYRIEYEMSILEHQLFETKNQIEEFEEKDNQRIREISSKARSLQIAYISSFLLSIAFGTYVFMSVFDFRYEYAPFVSFLIVLLLDLGFIPIFAQFLMLINSRMVSSYLNLLLGFSSIVLLILFVLARSFDYLVLSVPLISQLAYIAISLLAGSFYQQYLSFSWSTRLIKLKEKAELGLSALRSEHQRIKADVEAIDDLINSCKKKLKVQNFG